jgi:hypothetical protein
MIRILEEYKSEVIRLFPALSKDVLDSWSIKDADAIGLARFLKLYPRERVVVLDIGTFVGVSAFHLASQPKVAEVVSVDYNPSLAELQEWLTELGEQDDANALGTASSPETTVIEVARKAFSRFPEQQRKAKFVAGDAATVDMPIPADGASLVAFVDGHHGKEAVEVDLRAIFDKDSAAVAILHDCRGIHGPKIMAGIASFMQTSQTAYCFRLFEHTDRGPTPPDLCVVYPSTVAEEIEPAMSGLLASPKSSLIQAAFASWQAWDLQYKRADRHYERANTQQKLRKRVGERLQQQRRDWRREVDDRDQKLQRLMQELQQQRRQLKGLRERNRWLEEAHQEQQRRLQEEEEGSSSSSRRLLERLGRWRGRGKG